MYGQTDGRTEAIIISPLLYLRKRGDNYIVILELKVNTIATNFLRANNTAGIAESMFLWQYGSSVVYPSQVSIPSR